MSDVRSQAGTGQVADGTSTQAPHPHRRGAAELAEAWALPALTVALVVFFAFLPATTGLFNTLENARIVVSSQSAIVFVTLAVLLPIVVNVWDFTPGANAGLTSIVVAALMGREVNPVLAIAAGLATALAVAGLNALLVVGFRVNSVIATLGVTILIAGAIQVITGGGSLVKGIPEGLTSFGFGTTLGIPNLAYLAVLALVLVHLILTRTPFGRYLYATGSNRRAADLVGLRTNQLTVLAFVGGGVLAGIGGVLILIQTGAANPTVGPGFTLPAFAAIFLGTVAIRPGTWNVWGTAWAIVFLAVLASGLVLAGASNAISQFANGMALLVGVGLANLVARQRGRTIQVS